MYLKIQNPISHSLSHLGITFPIFVPARRTETVRSERMNELIDIYVAGKMNGFWIGWIGYWGFHLVAWMGGWRWAEKWEGL